MYPYLLLAKIVRQVGNHDLRLARDAILRRATLLALTGSLGLAGLRRVDSDAVSASRSGEGLVSGVGERDDLARNIGGSVTSSLLAVGGSFALASTAAASSTTTTTTATATTTGGLATTRSTLSALGTLSSGLRLAGKLDGDLAVEDGLAVQLLNGAVGLGGGRDVDKSVADRAGGARVGGDGGGLTARLTCQSRSSKLPIGKVRTYTR